MSHESDEILRRGRINRRLVRALRGCRALLGEVGNVLGESHNPAKGDPSRKTVRERAARVADAIGVLLCDGDDFATVAACFDELVDLEHGEIRWPGPTRVSDGDMIDGDGA